MNKADITNQIAYLQSRIQELNQRMQGGKDPWPAEREEIFEELHTSLEELQVAEEELRQQNDQLAASQLALEQERLRYQDLFEFAPDGYLVTDSQGKIREANQAAAGLFNISAQLLIGKPLAAYVAMEDRPYLRKQIFQACQLEGVERLEDWEVRIIPRDSIPFQAAITVCTKDGSKPDQVLKAAVYPAQPAELRWLIRDITPRKEAERALRESQDRLSQSEARFRTIFEQAEFGILLLDFSGKIIESNRAFQEMLDYTAEELRGRQSFDLLHPEDVEHSRESFRQVVSGQRQHHRGENRYLGRDRQIIWSHLGLSPFQAEAGRPEYIICMVENITSQKEIEGELAELELRLIESRETEQLHLAKELHDGPIQDLYGITFHLTAFNPSIHEDELRKQVVWLHSNIQEVIDHLMAICDELRPPTLFPFGLEKAIQSHAQNLQSLHPDITVSLELDQDEQTLPERVRVALFRIYQQMIENVIRHTRANALQVRLAIEPEQVRLSVSDDGEGFDVPERWIDLARQGRIGLARAAERAHSIGGELFIESSPESGTRVEVRVSRKNGYEPAPEEKPSGFVGKE